MREIGVHEARRDRVAGNVSNRHLARDRLRESDEPGFRRGVVRLTGVAGDTGDGRDVHDAPRALLHHRAHRGFRHQERAAQVQVDDRVPVLGAHPHEQVVARDARVVDEDVDPAAAERERGLHDVLGLAVDRHVALYEGRLTPALLDEGFRLRRGVRVSLVVDRDARAVTREANSGGASDPAASASDERGPTFELDAHALPKLAGTPSRRAAPSATGAPSA